MYINVQQKCLCLLKEYDSPFFKKAHLGQLITVTNNYLNIVISFYRNIEFQNVACDNDLTTKFLL
jgi:hypothetical protein